MSSWLPQTLTGQLFGIALVFWFLAFGLWLLVFADRVT